MGFAYLDILLNPDANKGEIILTFFTAELPGFKKCQNSFFL